jgi:hypothetical protein
MRVQLAGVTVKVEVFLLLPVDVADRYLPVTCRPDALFPDASEKALTR